jgi:hypothetical protein
MRNVSNKSYREKTKHRIYDQEVFPENHAVYETMSKKYDAADQVTGDNMMHAG